MSRFWHLLLCGCLVVCFGFATIQTELNPVSVVHEADEHYLSIALDCSLIKDHWKSFNASDPKVVALTRGLSPAILRLGGTACDYTVFNSTDNSLPADLGVRYGLVKNQHSIVLQTSDWDKLINLANSANLILLYDANVMLRDANNNWDPSNFKKFLSYNQAKGNKRLIFELGNEPNSFRAHFNRTITGTQLAKDFLVMRTLIQSNPYYRGSKIVGADTSRPHVQGTSLESNPATYMQEFFQAGHEYIDALTWHQYYMNGRTAKLDDFVNPAVMDVYKAQVDVVASIMSKILGGNPFPVWMGETSSAYGGGAPYLSNSYVAGFLWMDKLGVAAANGYDIVIRQAFYNGWYALIDDDLNPLPDYWLSVLYKRLVGTRVLNVTQSTEGVQSKYVRVYAHCTSQRALYSPGSVTVYAMNLNKDTSVKIFLPLHYDTVYSYRLEPPGGNLQSQLVNLNGKTLELTTSNQLPPLDPVKTSTVSLEPLTFGLFVIEAHLDVCK